jgi:hypothetical protein
MKILKIAFFIVILFGVSASFWFSSTALAWENVLGWIACAYCFHMSNKWQKLAVTNLETAQFAKSALEQLRDAGARNRDDWARWNQDWNARGDARDAAIEGVKEEKKEDES